MRRVRSSQLQRRRSRFGRDRTPDLGLCTGAGDVDRRWFRQRAVEIDTTEIAALYQLGRIARLEGRLPSDTELRRRRPTRREPRRGEVWREVGATYTRRAARGRLRGARRYIRAPTNAEGCTYARRSRHSAAARRPANGACGIEVVRTARHTNTASSVVVTRRRVSEQGRELGEGACAASPRANE